jgi:hypothetical protein
MFEQIGNGFVGLFLFISHWLSPGASKEEIRIAAVEEMNGGYVVECAIAIGWNEQIADLIDAGIPLRFRMSGASDAGDTAVFVRTLSCDIASYTYSFVDTFITPYSDTVRVSRSYGQAVIAMRDFSRWPFVISKKAQACYLEAELLPSRASRLNRTVEMSNICGCSKFTRSLIVHEGTRRSRRERK